VIIIKSKRRIIYEIYFPAFCKDLQDLTNKTSYFKELGVTTLWLTPIFPSCNQHGYDIIDYTDIKKEYGTLEDFDRFVEVAHENNLEVLLDLVLCHTSTQNELFKESIKGNNDCYFWSDKQQNNQWRICHDNQKYYLAKWSYDMPQLNNQSETVRDMIKDIIKFWLIEHNVDGFRLDAIKYASGDPIEFWKWFCQEVYKIKSNSYLVGECWDTYEVSNKYAKETGMKSFNFEQAGWIKHSLNTGNPLVIKNDPKYDVNFLCNHDMSRISNSIGHDMNKLFKAVDMLFSLDGDVCIYYGDEINMGLNQDCHVEQGGHGDWKVRRSMEWDKVKHERKDPNSLFNYYKKKIKEYKK
jgi:glycosidase